MTFSERTTPKLLWTFDWPSVSQSFSLAREVASRPAPTRPDERRSCGLPTGLSDRDCEEQPAQAQSAHGSDQSAHRISWKNVQQTFQFAGGFVMCPVGTHSKLESLLYIPHYPVTAFRRLGSNCAP